MPEVENELSWHRKFKDRFESDLRKALAADVITTFDYSRPELQLSRFLPAAQVATTVRAILDTGRQYEARVHPGEAYSHAACIHLDAPLLSHDRDAVRVLEANRLKTAAPMLRVFDLIALAYRKNARTLKDCDAIRQTLYAASEFVPKVLKRASFEDGSWTIRTHLRRLTRLSNGFSRKRSNLRAAMALFSPTTTSARSTGASVAPPRWRQGSPGSRGRWRTCSRRQAARISAGRVKAWGQEEST